MTRALPVDARRVARRMPTISELRRDSLEQARSIAVRLEQDLAHAEATLAAVRVELITTGLAPGDRARVLAARVLAALAILDGG